MGELSKAFRLEQDLVHILKEHKAQLEKSLESIHEFADNVENMYQNEGCWPIKDNKCSEEEIAQKIVGNPIYNFQVIKRLLVNLKDVEEKLRDMDVKSIK